MTEKRERRALRRFKKAIEWLTAIFTLGRVTKEGIDSLRKK